MIDQKKARKIVSDTWEYLEQKRKKTGISGKVTSTTLLSHYRKQVPAQNIAMTMLLKKMGKELELPKKSMDHILDVFKNLNLPVSEEHRRDFETMKVASSLILGASKVHMTESGSDAVKNPAATVYVFFHNKDQLIRDLEQIGLQK